ncbi:hypothetical protein IQ265_09735 [Nodosilinea sp. LEGE 06152]|uniref:hypothetical protein n=1 Tax=Nodosilinea sp. LEGE 06152 TaxID=2777966 RepID=UPI001880CE4B|nr:hypothetical protein [Nodosilinea sp. LEGE 06152]MBE9157103.1 hypothetical protein [Nodosilinea sp. LEGE 06152]
MNRFIIGGILAAIAVMLTGGLNRLLSDRSQGAQLTSQRNTTAESNGGDLGSVPLEQAGRLVQRQSEVGTNGISATGNSTFTDQNSNRATISPNTTGTAGANGGSPASGNVIPRPGGAATFPAATGDIAPIQPGLVQPGEVARPAPDPELDSIPALW